MLFEKYLQDNIYLEWKDYYINYGYLKTIIENIINKKPNSEKIFVKELEKSWIKYYNFASQLIDSVIESELNKNKLVDIFKINEFISINQEGFRKIIKKHDKNSNYSLYPAWKWKIKSNTFEKLFPTIKKISQLYPRDEHMESKIDNSSFKRKSIKYWVEKKNIIPVICHIIPNLPIYVWDEDINDHIYQEISSVYFDNKNLKTYHTRINKEENNKLIRIRWYGELPEKVFIERKVHHEDWTGIDSSKDRININTSEVMPFIRRNIRYNNDLANEIQDCITKEELYPIVRTTYNRISFQLKTTNEVRISLDINLKMIKEKVSHLDWFTDNENILEEDIINFPYSVLEVKIATTNDSVPDWVQSLMNSNLIIPQPNFSKYIHGCYSFYQDMVTLRPSWVSNDVVININDEVDNEIISVVDSQNNCCNSIGLSYRKFMGKDIKVAEPVKIEPKTFFANERTYLQWFNSAVLVASVGTALMAQVDKLVGILLILVSFLILIYSLAIYFRRNNMLLNRIGNGYSDTYGPIFLTISLLVAFGISIFLL